MLLLFVALVAVASIAAVAAILLLTLVVIDAAAPDIANPNTIKLFPTAIYKETTMQ